MTDIALNNITSGYNVSKINDNFDEIENAVNNQMLHTTGGNNTMSQQLDMNGNKIINIVTDVNDPTSLLTVGAGDSRYYNVSGDTLTGPMNANGQRINNLPSPSTTSEPVIKGDYDTKQLSQDNIINANKLASVRAPDGEVLSPMTSASNRNGKLLSFDATGNPIVVAPSTSVPADASSVIWTRAPLTQAVGTVHQGLDQTPINVWEYAGLITNKPNPNDPTTWDWTPAIQAMIQYCIDTGASGKIPAGRYPVVPGMLSFDSGWTDKSWPDILTDGYSETTLVAAADIDAPMLSISNGTATSQTMHVWSGGSIGGLTFEDPYTGSSATSRHGLSLTGVQGMDIGYMCGIGLRGDVVRIPRKLISNNPDPYHVALCEFSGIEGQGCYGYALKNDNFVGLTHCNFGRIRSVDSASGGISGMGTCCSYSHVSIGNCLGWAITVPKDLIAGTRNIIELLELDNVQQGISLPYIAMLEIKQCRFVHRFQTTPNTSAVYWPTISVDFGNDAAPQASNIEMRLQHRINTGGSLGAIGTFYAFGNNANVSDIIIRSRIDDDAGLGITDGQIVSNLATASLGVAVFRGAKQIAGTTLIPGSAITGTTGVSVPNSGFTTVAAKLIFPNEVYDRGSYYDPSTGYFTVPYSGLYQFSGSIALTVASGTRVRVAVAFNRSGTIGLMGSRTQYASSAAAQTYSVEGVSLLNAGDQVFLMADQNTGGAVNLSQINQVASENQWSIRALQ